MTAIDTAKALVFTGGTIPTAGVSAGDLAAETTARNAAFNAAGLIGLVNVAGTPDAITADLPPDVGTATFVAGKAFRFTALADATVAIPTITVAGVTRRFCDIDLSAMAVGSIKAGRTYVFETYGSQFARLIFAGTTRAEQFGWSAADSALAAVAGVIGLVNLAGTPDAITADFPAGVGAQTFTAGKLVRVTPVADATIASASVTVAGVTRTIRDVDLSVFTAPFLKVGRSYIFETYGASFLRLAGPALTQAELTGGWRTALENLQRGEIALDGSLRLIGLETDAGLYLGDLIRLYPDGLDLKLRPGSGGADLVSRDGWAVAAGRYTAQAGQNGVMAVDRFTDTPAPRRPIAVINGVSRKAVIVSVYGQSLGDVTKMGDPLVWLTPPMPHHAYMLNDMSVNTNRGGIIGWGGVAAPGATSMVPCNEGAQGIQSYASAAFARLNAMGAQPFRVGLIRSSAWGGNKLVGDVPSLGLWKDSDGAYTQAWLNWQRDINDAYAALTAAGYEVEAVHICFSHQEADWQTPRPTYRDQFLAMKAEQEARIEADHPGLRVHWFVDQASGSGLRTTVYQGGAWPDRMAIQDAVLAGGTNITMVTPRYWMTFGKEVDGVTQEDIHHAYIARIWQGEVYGCAMHEIVAGRVWRCPWPTGAVISGNDVVIDFDAIAPLVLDPTFCKVRPDMGFQVWTGAASVPATSVRLTGQRQVTCTFPSAPLAGQHIRYAYRSYDGQDVLDEWPLSTGALRDAWEAPSMFLPGKKLVRPALGFELQL